MTIKLNSNGLLAHKNFPSVYHNSIHAHVGKKYDNHRHYEHFAGAMNAVAYRYHGTQKAGGSLHASLKSNQGNAGPGEREKQEFDLFDFFSNGFSVFEASFYAAYSVGAFQAPATFSLETEKDQQKISPAYTVAAYKREFGQDALTKTLSEIIVRPNFLKWKEIRNVLTHRASPGRKIYVSIGRDFVPAAEWKLANISLDEQMVPAFEASMNELLQELFLAFDDFVVRKL